ncbi:hypothetical protein IG631_22082 [Alternaria alternata]|nr:hypothetical protein IG631_22082 [Alternaria alternata]
MSGYFDYEHGDPFDLANYDDHSVEYSGIGKTPATGSSALGVSDEQAGQVFMNPRIAYVSDQSPAHPAVDAYALHVNERQEQYRLPVTSDISAINAVLPERAAPQIPGVSGHESPHIPTANDDSEHMVIGIILSNGEVRGDRYQCNKRACSGRTFGRLADLKRHYSSVHGGAGGKGQRTWCPVDGCESTSTMPSPPRHQARQLRPVYRKPLTDIPRPYARQQKQERHRRAVSEEGQDDGPLDAHACESDELLRIENFLNMGFVFFLRFEISIKSI